MQIVLHTVPAIRKELLICAAQAPKNQWLRGKAFFLRPYRTVRLGFGHFSFLGHDPAEGVGVGWLSVVDNRFCQRLSFLEWKSVTPHHPLEVGGGKVAITAAQTYPPNSLNPQPNSQPKQTQLSKPTRRATSSQTHTNVIVLLAWAVCVGLPLTGSFALGYLQK